MNLFVSNISKNVKDEVLKALFSEFGEVISAKVLTDKQTGESRGFGFVDMASEQHAQEAMRKLTNAEFFGRRLLVSKARPKPSAY
jgi:RNA recognition motif-containing protein